MVWGESLGGSLGRSQENRVSMNWVLKWDHVVGSLVGSLYRSEGNWVLMVWGKSPAGSLGQSKETRVSMNWVRKWDRAVTTLVGSLCRSGGWWVSMSSEGRQRGRTSRAEVEVRSGGSPA